MGNKSENAALNVIRTVSALLVVLSHARGWLLVPVAEAGGNPIVRMLYALTGLGHGAVLVFFVLSGFFVGGAVINGERGGYFSWKAYSVSRVVRLWIVLLPALVLTVVMDLLGRTLFPGSDRFGPQSEAVLHTSPLTFLGNALFLQPTYVPTLGSNGALWSLTFEFAYYAIFPIILVGVIRGVGLRRYVAVLFAILLCIFFGLHVVVLFSTWLLGAIIAAYSVRIVNRVCSWPRSIRMSARLAAGAALLGAMVVDKIIGGGSPEVTTPASFGVALIAAVFIGLLLPGPVPKNAFGRVVFGWGSKLAHSSYSLYAMHLPVLTFMVIAISPGGQSGSTPASPVGWATVVLIVALLVAVGWAFAQVTEKRTKKVTTWFLRGRRRESSLVGG